MVEGIIAVGAGSVALHQFGEEQGVVVGAEEVAGVQVAFAPGLVRAPGKLPVVEAGAEAAGDGLRVLGALVVTEAVVGEAQGLREHPAFAVVLGEEVFDALLAVTAGGFDLRFEVVEGDEGQDGVAEFGVFVRSTRQKPLGCPRPVSARGWSHSVRICRSSDMESRMTAATTASTMTAMRSRSRGAGAWRLGRETACESRSHSPAKWMPESVMWA